LLYEKKTSAAADLLPSVLENWLQPRRPILLIAEDVDGDALATLVVNTGILNRCRQSPGFGATGAKP